MVEHTVETAVFGGGCFWCIEAVMQRLRGVRKVTSGFAGGETEANYWEVARGLTNHAEVVQVEFEPSVISYTDLLGVFFASHDPTTKDRQGNDVGPQYRSIIFTTNAAQAAAAQKTIRHLTDDRVFTVPIVTEVVPLRMFYPATDDHQNFYDRNPESLYCQVVISPKVAKLRQKFAHLLKN